MKSEYHAKFKILTQTEHDFKILENKSEQMLKQFIYAVLQSFFEVISVHSEPW